MIIVHTETINGKGVYDVYKEMKKVGHDVKIVAIPSSYGKHLLAAVDTNFTEKFDEKDVIYPCGKSAPYTQCESIEQYKTDYLFIQNPYDSYVNTILDAYFLTSNLKKYAKKIMFIVYGPHLFHQDFANDTNLPNLVDVAFVDSESTKDIYVKRYDFPNNRVVVSGYQNYKTLRDIIKEISNTQNKETILWLPRWSLSLRNRELFEGGSTFLNYYHFFYNYAKQNPDINFIVRPHYLLFSYAVDAFFLSKEDLDEIFQKFRSLSNVTISMPTDRPLIDDVLASDVIISDGSSALGEVVVADNPIIYLSNGWNNEFNSNELSRKLKNYIYFAYEPGDIPYHLEHIRKDNYHPFPEPKCEGIKSHIRANLAYFKRKLLNQPCNREEFKELLDPVENPAQLKSSI